MPLIPLDDKKQIGEIPRPSYMDDANNSLSTIAANKDDD
jgi:hypothetical protein